MIESPAGYLARTGRPYDPLQSITRTAASLGTHDSCPTLFRFPGGCGLAELFLGGLATLGRAADTELWAAENPLNAEAPGAAHFGTIALLQPLAFGMCRHSPGIWVGANRMLEDPGRIAWIPPSAIGAPIPWDRVADASELDAMLGSGIERERGEVIDALDLYAREVEAIAKAGVPDPEIRWCDRPEELRARLLAEFGVAAVWTGTTRTRAAGPSHRAGTP